MDGKRRPHGGTGPGGQREMLEGISSALGGPREGGGIAGFISTLRGLFNRDRRDRTEYAPSGQGSGTSVSVGDYGLPDAPTPGLVSELPTFEVRSTRDTPDENERQVQEWLVMAGYPVGVDGYFGPESLRALNEFATEQGIDSVVEVGDEVSPDVLWMLKVQAGAN